MNRRKLHDLGVGLRAGDRNAAFRLQQRLRGKMSAEAMKARGYPNLGKARDKRRARLRTAASPAQHIEARANPAPQADARLSVIESRHIICCLCGFGQNVQVRSGALPGCIACHRPLY